MSGTTRLTINIATTVFFMDLPFLQVRNPGQREDCAPHEKAEARAFRGRVRQRNDAWVIDLTAVPATGFGFWISWLPNSAPQCWPFCYWVGAVLDMYSRRVLTQWVMTQLRMVGLPPSTKTPPPASGLATNTATQATASTILPRMRFCSQRALPFQDPTQILQYSARESRGSGA